MLTLWPLGDVAVHLNAQINYVWEATLIQAGGVSQPAITWASIDSNLGHIQLIQNYTW